MRAYPTYGRAGAKTSVCVGAFVCVHNRMTLPSVSNRSPHQRARDFYIRPRTSQPPHFWRSSFLRAFCRKNTHPAPNQHTQTLVSCGGAHARTSSRTCHQSMRDACEYARVCLHITGGVTAGGVSAIWAKRMHARSEVDGNMAALDFNPHRARFQRSAEMQS